MDEEKLIILVSGYKELYDFSDKSYSNQERKNNCWKEISEHMRQPVSVCKERWSRLRDNYRKALKFRKGKSGDAAVKVKPYKFEAEMSFLKKYMPNRDQKTNVTESLTAANSSIPSEDGEDDRMGANDNLIEASSSNSTVFRTTPTLTPTSAPKRKKVPPENTQPSSVASVLEKCLQTTTATNSGDNSLKQFFTAMSETAQTFPPEVQIEVKGKIFNIIQKAELNCLQPRNTTQFDNSYSTGFNCNQTVYPRQQYTQHSYKQHMEPLGTQHNITYLNLQHTQHSHPQNTLALQPRTQDMQPSPLQHIQPTYSSISPSSLGSPEY